MKRTLIMGVVLVAALLSATSALADGKTVGPNHVLQVENGGAGTTVAWQRGADSRFDDNQRRLHAVVADGSYFALYTTRSLDMNRPVLNAQNLSFEFAEGSHVGAGAPRISLILDDGSVLYLSAFYCNQHIPGLVGSGPQGGTPMWGRADFTRDLTDCAIFDSGGTEYSADGSRTALEVYDAAHPGAVIDQAYMVGDEPGRYNLDRISLGSGRMYVRSFHSAVRCRSEGAC